jgi:D-arabinose 5-phosphate isomerase GutQ
MLRPHNYLILQILSQVVEIIAVTSHPYNQIAIQFRVLLRFPESSSIDNIKLDMMPVKSKIAADQGCQTIVALLILKKLRREFLIQQCTSSPEVVYL